MKKQHYLFVSTLFFMYTLTPLETLTKLLYFTFNWKYSTLREIRSLFSQKKAVLPIKQINEDFRAERRMTDCFYFFFLYEI